MKMIINFVMEKDMLKKMLSAMCAAILPLVTLASCGENPAADNGKINVVCTIFPCYDWTRQVVGDTENVDITYLLDDGSDLHSFQPTAEDMIKISDCDVFVYVGGESDQWVEKALENARNKDMKILRLMDGLTDYLTESENSENVAEHHNHEEHEEHDHHESVYDEHIWLSLNNAQMCVSEISTALSAADSENADTYSENASAYSTELQLLDRSFHMMFDEKPHTLIFGDQFPFIYFTECYGLDYFAAFSGCSADTESSFETITFLAEKVDELKAETVFAIENSDCTIAEAVISNTADKSQNIAILDSIQSVSQKKIDEGYTYLEAMKKNYDVLKEVYNS